MTAFSLSVGCGAVWSGVCRTMKMMAGVFFLASSKSVFTSRSDSPWYFDTRSELDTDRKQEPASVATALARKDLPADKGRQTRECEKRSRFEGMSPSSPYSSARSLIRSPR